MSYSQAQLRGEGFEVNYGREANNDHFKATHYDASTWGQQYHTRPEREVLGAGSAGPGKSLVLLMDPVDRILIDHWRCMGEVPSPYCDSRPDIVNVVKRFPLKWGESPGWALHLRRAFPMLSQTIARSMRIFPHLDDHAHFDKKEFTWHFRSGYRLQFGHCLNPDDWQKYDSSQYDWIGYDELVQFNEEQFQNINTRLRSGDPVHRTMLKIRAMSNPVRKVESGINVATIDPQWVRKRFVDPHPEGNVVIRRKLKRLSDGSEVFRDRLYLPARLYDNPDAEFVKQYEEELLDKPPHIRQAMLFGNWYITVGSYYGDDWNPQIHTCQAFRIPTDWPQWRSMDWGYKSQGVVLWWAMDYDGNIFCHREFTFKGMDATQVAKEIQRIEKDMKIWDGGKSGVSGAADTNIWEDRKGTKTIAQEFHEAGVDWLPANKKSRIGNASLFLGRLRDHKQHNTTPGIVFFRNCKNCIKTIPGIQANPHQVEEPMKGGDDHHHDAVLYSCAFAAHGAAGIPSRRVTRDEDRRFANQPGRARNQRRGRNYGYGYRA